MGFILLLLLCLQVCCHGKHIIRAGHGVIFLETKRFVDTMQTEFDYVFAKKLPTHEIHEREVLFCNRLNTSIDDFQQNALSTCIAMQNYLDTVYTDALKFKAVTEQQIAWLQQILPHYNESDLADIRRKRTKIFSWIGSLLETATGIPSEASFNRLLKHVSILENNQESSDERIVNLANDFSAYVLEEDSRWKSLAVKVAKNNRLLVSKINQIVQSYATIASDGLNHVQLLLQLQMIQTDVLFHSKDTDLVMGYLNSESFILRSTDTLLRNKLPILLVNPIDLKTALRATKSQLQKHNADILHHDLKFYYQHAQVSTLISAEYLYVCLHIPLYMPEFESHFKLYRVFSYPIQMFSNSTLYSKVGKLPAYYAISESKQLALDLSVNDLAMCGNDISLQCVDILSVRKTNTESCVDSLFTDNLQKANDVCQMSVSQKSDTGVLVVNNTALILNDDVYTLRCMNGSDEIIQCNTSCFVNVPCDCRLLSKKSVLHYDLDTCGALMNISYFHNNAFLNYAMGNLPPSFHHTVLSKQADIINLPPISAEFLENMKDLSFDNSQDMKLLVNLTHAQVRKPLKFSWDGKLPTFYQTSCIIIATLIAILSMILSCVIATKVIRMSIVVNTLQTAQAFELREQIKWSEPGRMPLSNFSLVIPQEKSEVFKAFDWYLIALYCGVTLCAMTCIICGLYFALKNRKIATKLSVLIFDKTRHVNLNLMTIKAPISHIEVKGGDICSGITIRKDMCVPYVFLKWNDLKIRAFGCKLALPSSLRLSLFEYRQLQEIIHHNFCTLILIKQNTNVIGYVGFLDKSLKLPILQCKGKRFSLYESLDEIPIHFNRTALRRTVE